MAKQQPWIIISRNIRWFLRFRDGHLCVQGAPYNDASSVLAVRGGDIMSDSGCTESWGLFGLPSECTRGHTHSVGFDCHSEACDIELKVRRRCCKSAELPKGCECFDTSLNSNYNNLRRPHCPSDLGVRFFLYTRSNQQIPEVVQASDVGLSASTFEATRPTRIFMHGWTGKAPDGWSVDMKEHLLAGEDVNVILVNWRKGAMRVYYQSVANIRTVGAMVANLVVEMASIPGGDLQNFHLIGHSLGAHMAGYAGKEVYRLTSDKIARITGLDPAGLAFQGHSPSVRLDKTDAHFVDVIHTDAEPILTSGYGIQESIGHADYYPNGGKHQPGCPKEVLQFLYLLDFQGTNSVGVCSHVRVLEYFSSSITMCRYDPPREGSKCTMGYHASPTCRGDFFPETTAVKPYC